MPQNKFAAGAHSAHQTSLLAGEEVSCPSTRTRPALSPFDLDFRPNVWLCLSFLFNVKIRSLFVERVSDVFSRTLFPTFFSPAVSRRR